MDGWESRRKRTPGHDFAIVRLGLRGVVRGVVVDTAFFRGNYPSHCSIEACHEPEPDRIGADREDNGHSLTCGLRCARRGDIPSCRYDYHALCHKLGRECRQSLIVPICPPFLDNFAGVERHGQPDAEELRGIGIVAGCHRQRVDHLEGTFRMLSSGFELLLPFLD